MALHETDLGRNRHGLQALSHAQDEGLLNATINPLTTVAGLKTAVSALVVHETDQNILRNINQNIDRLQAIGSISDAGVAAADTNAGLQALPVAQDASLTAPDRKTFAIG